MNAADLIDSIAKWLHTAAGALKAGATLAEQIPDDYCPSMEQVAQLAHAYAKFNDAYALYQEADECVI